MAQKREKEVTELKVPESLPMRIPTISSPQQISVARPPEISDPNASGACDRRASSADSQPDPLITEEKQRNSKRPREATRCSGSDCRKRVGLTGFRCRCGDVFCSQHMYSDRHDCSYDYKTAGREAIARENPVVRAAKLVKV